MDLDPYNNKYKRGFEPKYPGLDGDPPANKVKTAITFVLLVLGIIILWAIFRRPPLPTASNRLIVRVVDSSGSAVIQAKVILLLAGEAKIKLSDSNGLAIFDGLPDSDGNASLIVEAEQYQVYNANFSLPATELSVPLENKNAIVGTVIVRVLDERDSRAVVGAVVVLIVDGEEGPQSAPADSNGITRFNINFQPDTGKADLDIRVEAAGFDINQQRVTLLVNSLQDIRLKTNSFYSAYFDPTHPTPIGIPTSTNTPTPIPSSTNTPTPLPTTTATPTPTLPPTNTLTPTLSPINTLTSTPDPSVCVLTIVNPFALLMSEPDTFSRQLKTIDSGEYIALDFRVTTFGSNEKYWFQIEVNGQIGWVEDNIFNIASKSAACP